jgi:hypothetical protein
LKLCDFLIRVGKACPEYFKHTSVSVRCTTAGVLPVRAVDDAPSAQHPAVIVDFAEHGRRSVPGLIRLTRENDMKKRFAGVLAVAGAWLACMVMANAQTMTPPAAASDKDQHRISDQDLALLRKDLRSQKKQLIAQNLKLSDAEATKFWPIYDQYVAELTKINDKKYATIQEYADKFGTLSDDQAMSLIRNWLDVDIAASQLRAKYLPIVAKAVGGKQAATFAQLDRRIASMVDLQLGSQIPLVQTQSQ